MHDLFFLPDWPLQVGAFPWFAILLLAAVLAGEAMHRFFRLPRLLGWIACGAAAGGSGLGLLDAGSLKELRWLLDIAAGLLLFELGQRVDYAWLRRNPWLLASSLLEGALAFGAVYVVLILIGIAPLPAAVAAAIAMASSPSVALALTRETRAQGQVTERILLFTALNCIYAFITVSMLIAWLHSEYRGNWLEVALHPLYLIFGSLIVAVLFAASTLALLRRLGHRPDAQYIAAVALVVLAVACAESLRLSVPLALLAYGAITRVYDRDRRFVSLDFGRLGQIALILLFAITAAAIDLRLLPVGIFAGAAFLAARWFGKACGVFLLARASGLSMRKASLVSLGLMPMSALSLILVHDLTSLFPELGIALATMMMSALAMLEVIGPLTARYALQQAGETAPQG